MYPRNAASPERIAIGAVVQISDGAVQTTGIVITVRGQGAAESSGAGTTTVGASGIVYYTPTQAETNFTSFVVIASKTGCIPVAQTIVTTASVTPGQVRLEGVTHTGAVVPTVTTVNGLAANVITATAIAADAIQAAKIQASALNGKGDWNIGKTGYSLSSPQTINITGNLSGSVGSVTGLNAANLDATVSSRLATAGYTAPDNAGISANNAAIAVVQSDTDNIQTRLPAALVGGRMASIAEVVGDKTDYTILAADQDILVDLVWDEVLSAATHNVNQSAGRRLRQISAATTAYTGNVVGSPTTTVLQLSGSPSSTDNFYVPGLAVIDSSFGIQFARIKSYDGTQKEITLATPLSTVPNSGDSIEIAPWASVRVTEIDEPAMTDVVNSIWDELTAESRAVGSYGALFAGILDVAISTRLADGSYVAPDNAGIADVQSRLPATLNGGRMRAITEVFDAGAVLPVVTSVTNRVDANVDQIDGQLGAAQKLRASTETIVPAVAQAGSTTTVILTDLVETTSDHYKGRVVFFRTGVLAGQGSPIEAYNGGTGALTVTLMTDAPANGDLFVIL